MKVLLLQDLKGQGKKGEIISVSDGYARNYLFPRKIASEATQGVMKSVMLIEKAQKQAEERERLAFVEVSKNLESMIVRITAKAGTAGRLFGSVTSKEIAEELLRQHKIDIDKRKINLPEPIKQYGSVQVSAKLGHGVEATINVLVTEE